MINEAIIISLTSPLLLHVMFFMMKNVRAFCGIAQPSCETWLGIWQQNSSTLDYLLKIK
jgi:hypothetical protein